jgi:hypothetical protein
MTPLSRTLTMSITAAMTIVILVAGSVYSLIRPANYKSDAKVVLVPEPTNPESTPGLLDSYVRSGTGGTYVELLLSQDTIKRAGNPPVELTAHAIPDTRTIAISAKSGDRGIVSPALTALLNAAQDERQKLGDDWRIRILQSPTAASEANTSTGITLIATVTLALLGALASWTLLRRLGNQRPRGAQRRGDEVMPTPGWVTREGRRYPVNR